MRKFVLFVLFLALGVGVRAQETFERRMYVSAAGDTLRYRALAPETLEAGVRYPLVLFLHGAGERGRDNEAQLVHGGEMFLNPVVRETYPAFVVAPQCPPERYWAYEERPESFAPWEMPVVEEPASMIRLVMEVVGLYLAMPEVDASRVYVMGLSMGGMATYDLMVRYPEVFAAAVPICGTVHPGRLSALPGVAVSIYHGDHDTVVPVEASRAAYRALKAAGAAVRYKEFVGCTHGSWNPAFNEPDFWPWLFARHK